MFTVSAPANCPLWHGICNVRTTGIRFTAGLPHGVSGESWRNGCLAPAIHLAEVVLARQRPRFYARPLTGFAVGHATRKVVAVWPTVAVCGQIPIRTIFFGGTLFDFSVAYRARDSRLAFVHQKGEQVGNFP